jgi:hypothetical protein
MQYMGLKLFLLPILIGCLSSPNESIADPLQHGEPFRMTVRSVELVQMGMFVDDPKYIFALVNIDKDECFAVAPPGGVTVFAIRNYMVVDEPGIPEFVRAALFDLDRECRMVRLAP